MRRANVMVFLAAAGAATGVTAGTTAQQAGQAAMVVYKSPT